MTDRNFPILGTTVPPMIGREAILTRMLSGLTKPNPDHLQMVGARFAGKTVILHELARRLQDSGKPYTAILIWDLGHQTPGTDDLFMQRFAQQLSKSLSINHAVYAEHLNNIQSNPYQEIAEVLEALNDDGGKILAIMDGFDKPLSNGNLTRNLWDQLRELALKPSLRLITASRRTLRDLIRNPDSQTSDFWNIFEPTPIRVGVFDDLDMRALLSCIPGIELTSGAQTELWNASNGFPIIVLEVLNSLVNGGAQSITPECMRAACDESYPAIRDKLDALWTDCPPSCQDLMIQIREQSTVAKAGISSADVETLIERGFANLAANKLQRANRLLSRYLDEQPNESSALARMFGEKDDYQRHFKGVLDRRIRHILGIDPTLKRYLVRGVEDLPDHPNIFLGNVHGILEQILSLIWKAECWNAEAGKPRIPNEWFSIWRNNGEKSFDEWLTRFPEGGQRLRLLDLMTGTQRSDRLALFVTKNTYVLANSVQGFRDFGVHPKATHIDLGTAYAALNVCIELAAVVTAELSVKPSL